MTQDESREIDICMRPTNRDLLRSGKRRHFAALPCCRLHGPPPDRWYLPPGEVWYFRKPGQRIIAPPPYGIPPFGYLPTLPLPEGPIILPLTPAA